jgi:aspartyl-tRNA(Asn)/glutamyl-tRNA(Gln) amidotransferase subunit A
MHQKTLKQLKDALHSKAVSSVELTQNFLDRIEQFDKECNTFITVCKQTALEQAQAADKLLQSGQGSDLTGIPIAQKDIFCTKDILTTCGSKMLSNFIAPYNATVVENFYRAGMVLLGKTNMDEFAMGASNETSYFGAAKNPWDVTRTPGGSSGGSVAAVAARLTPAATGTDTGGSIRQPAALTGTCGLKPTYGRVSRYGMIAFASSLDQGGPIAKTAEGLAMLLNAMVSHDPKDSTSINRKIPNYTSNLNHNIAGLKIGMPKEYFGKGLDPEIHEAIQNAASLLEKQGVKLVDISLPRSHLSVPVYYVLGPAEASSNLARYDGVRYGYRCENPKDLLDLYVRTRTNGFGNEVKRRILIGTYVLSSGYYDSCYIKAQKIRRLMSNDFAKTFESVDAILTPSSPIPAFKLGEKTQDPISMYLCDMNTIAVNLAGLPALSIPAGFTKKNLPIGLQLIGNYFDEKRLLNIAHQYQQLTDWHSQSPKGFK